MRIVREGVAPEPGKTVLDAGCGDGRLLLELEHSGAALFGIDASLKALRHAAGFNPRAGISAHDLAALGLKGETFSTITLIETLEHIPPERTDRVLSELNRVLKPGGSLLVSVPTPLLPRPAKHYRHFGPEELHSILSRHFNVERITGHCRRSRLYDLLVAVGDNGLWHLRAGYNGLLRSYFRRSIEHCPPDKALRLIAVCTKGL
jgi:2-polyprenyl-3-methyl-5-hydroxy-6-metoxy-1,4-benzoquinol methylase